MKKLIQKLLVLSIAFLLSIQLTSAQKADTSLISQSSSAYDLYLQRHKTFNTIGWLLLVPGAAVMTAGLVAAINNPIIIGTPPAGYNENAGEGAILVGGALMAASVPCFLIAHSNKRKAYVQLKSGNVPGLSGFNYAAISLKINL